MSIHTNHHEKWIGPAEVFRYYFQIPWDPVRRIVVAQIGPGDVAKTVFEASSTFDFTEEQDSDHQLKDGILIILKVKSPQPYWQRPTPLRLYRKMLNRQNSNSLPFDEYVDIPVTGGSVLFDNGVSVNGYKWQPCTNTERTADTGEFPSSNPTINSMYVEGDNVKCTATSGIMPDDNSWELGDMLLNIGDSENWVICVKKSASEDEE